MPKSFLFALFLMLATGLFAQQFLNVGYVLPSVKNTGADSIIVDTNLQQNVLAHVDSSVFLAHWHTHKTHVDSIDLSAVDDTFAIALLDSLHPDFYLPCPGEVRDVFRWRNAYRHHNGVDIKLRTGDTVCAAFDGVVRYAKYNRGGYGNLVIVRHYNGLETYYAHFSKILVDTNAFVRAGTPIGLGGSTGRSTGPHLHFEVRYLGNPFNPELIIDWHEQNLETTNLAIHKELFEHIEEQRQRKYYRVKSGDSLSRIARRSGTSVRNLCRLNGIKSTSIIRIGQRLRIR